MLPFMGYHMSDYFQHWLNLGAALARTGATVPRIFTTIWFRKGETASDAGKFVWPGYGENMRALKWMIDRIEGRVSGTDNVFGVSPSYGEMNWSGLDFSPAQFDTVTRIDTAAWQKELVLHTELFTQLAHHLPAELLAVKAQIEKRLAA